MSPAMSSSIVSVIFTLSLILVDSNQLKVDNLCGLTTDQLITLYGYTAEIHKVTTQDGYILTTFRCNSKTQSTKKRKPVLLQHGLLSSSDDYCLSIRNQSLAYILADADYDVWLMNSRGNTYSRNHISKNPDKSSSGFWKFSWYEIGIYDTAAVIDYILAKTNSDKVYYIGMSQGTTTLLVLLSERPEYNDRIHAASLIAPVGYLKRLQHLSQYINLLLPYMETFENREIFPRNSTISELFISFCAMNIQICQNFLNSALNYLLGPSDNLRDSTMLLANLCHGPSGASVNQFLHYAQMITHKYFGRYMIHGQKTPPDFALVRITAPVSLHFSSSDRLVSVEDVEKLTSTMKNVVSVQYINQTKFNHIDFIYDTRAYSMVYSKILKVFQDLH